MSPTNMLHYVRIAEADTQVKAAARLTINIQGVTHSTQGAGSRHYKRVLKRSSGCAGVSQRREIA